MEELVSEKGMRVFEDFFGRARGAGLDGEDGGEDGDGVDGRRVWRVWTYLLHVCAEIEVVPRKAFSNPQMPD
jgi:hypothetical protein